MEKVALNEDSSVEMPVESYEELKELALENEIRSVLNRYSAENGSNTPDFILAQYLMGCLRIFNATIQKRTKWYEPDSVNSGDGPLPFPVIKE